MKTMTLGNIVDFCIECTNRRMAALSDIGGTDKEPTVKRRKATQADWDNFWG